MKVLALLLLAGIATAFPEKFWNQHAGVRGLHVGALEFEMNTGSGDGEATTADGSTGATNTPTTTVAQVTTTEDDSTGGTNPATTTVAPVTTTEDDSTGGTNPATTTGDDSTGAGTDDSATGGTGDPSSTTGEPSSTTTAGALPHHSVPVLLLGLSAMVAYLL